jgi:hypothetical protein
VHQAVQKDWETAWKRSSTYGRFEGDTATVGREIMNQPPYSFDFVPGDFNLFWPMKVHTEGQKLQTDKPFMLLATVACHEYKTNRSSGKN